MGIPLDEMKEKSLLKPSALAMGNGVPAGMVVVAQTEGA
jgi:hypothetical protein